MPLRRQIILVTVLLTITTTTTTTIASDERFIVKTLPGYPGELPFTLETGYVSVGNNEDVNLFYYFIESEGNPNEDPLVLWLIGGPGCSGLSALVFEIGPIAFDTLDFDGINPKLILNPYSWTKVASIIFVDAPIGAGFSYANNPQSYIIDDRLSAEEDYQFLRKWLLHHPQFLSNELYICGNSYSGIVLPIVVQIISDANEAGQLPILNLKGYSLGNPLTNKHDDINARVDYAHKLSLLSDHLYESTKRDCHGDYLNVDPGNTACVEDLQIVDECLVRVNKQQVLEPYCSFVFQNRSMLRWDERSLKESPIDFLAMTPQDHSKVWCRDYTYVQCFIWANDPAVQDALYVHQGIGDWTRCNYSLAAYSKDVYTSIDYHRNLSKKILRALIYSGDHDMSIPYVGTLKWIVSLDLPIEDDWKSWLVDGQVAGYTMTYASKGFSLTFATIKGAGHAASEYRPKECFEMFKRWLTYSHL